MSETRSFESFSGDVDDEGEPNQALDIAGQAVRDFNHRSFGRMAIDKPGWQYAPDAYRSLGELTYLAGGLPQAFDQITAALVDQLDKGLIRIDRGTRYEDHPETAVAAAQEALQRAHEAAKQMSQGIADAQSAINAAAYNRPSQDRE